MDHNSDLCLDCGRIHECGHGKAAIYVDSADLRLQKRVVSIGNHSHVLLVEMPLSRFRHFGDLQDTL